MNIDKIKRNSVVTDGGCWEWAKSTNSAGYGQLTENKKYWTAHRYAYACFNDLSDRDLVRHLCHNRKCCNPSHLRKGSCKDNWNDSSEVYAAAAKRRRRNWNIAGVNYKTVREASASTGIHQATIIKYTKDGVFDYCSYLDGCKKARVAPKF